MRNIWDGTHLFIWDKKNVIDVNTMVEQAKKSGVTGVLIKFANGSLNGDPVSQGYMDKFKTLAPAFKAAGIKVGGWIYQYLTDVQGEVDACSQAISAGAEWIVLDGEVELRGKNAQVQQFGQLFRSRYPNYTLGLSSFAIADYHPEVPFQEYSAFVDVMLPQIYWSEMAWDVSVAFNASTRSYKKFSKPIAPTGQSYGQASSTDMGKFVSLCKQAGFSHLSWWDLDEATPVQIEAIRSNLLTPPMPISVPDMTQEDAQKVIDVLGALYNACLSPGVQNAAHFAADILRDAVGLPKQ